MAGNWQERADEARRQAQQDFAKAKTDEEQITEAIERLRASGLISEAERLLREFNANSKLFGSLGKVDTGRKELRTVKTQWYASAERVETSLFTTLSGEYEEVHTYVRPIFETRKGKHRYWHQATDGYDSSGWQVSWGDSYKVQVGEKKEQTAYTFGIALHIVSTFRLSSGLYSVQLYYEDRMAAASENYKTLYDPLYGTDLKLMDKKLEFPPTEIPSPANFRKALDGGLVNVVDYTTRWGLPTLSARREEAKQRKAER